MNIGLYESVEIFPAVVPKISPIGLIGPIGLPRTIPRWDEFTRRVKQGIEKLMVQHEANKRLVVFTSGGPISVTVQIALGLSDKKALEISWQLLNASITRIKYNSRGMMLAGFNEVTHLELEGDQGLITYR